MAKNNAAAVQFEKRSEKGESGPNAGAPKKVCQAGDGAIGRTKDRRARIGQERGITSVSIVASASTVRESWHERSRNARLSQWPDWAVAQHRWSDLFHLVRYLVLHDLRPDCGDTEAHRGTNRRPGRIQTSGAAAATESPRSSCYANDASSRGSIATESQLLGIATTALTREAMQRNQPLYSPYSPPRNVALVAALLFGIGALAGQNKTGFGRVNVRYWASLNAEAKSVLLPVCTTLRSKNLSNFTVVIFQKASAFPGWSKPLIGATAFLKTF
jgi:hypothetical protein